MGNFTVEMHVENGCSWPQDFLVNKGYEYCSYGNTEWCEAEADTYVRLYCKGDWVEIRDNEGNCVRHEIY